MRRFAQLAAAFLCAGVVIGLSATGRGAPASAAPVVLEEWDPIDMEGLLPRCALAGGPTRSFGHGAVEKQSGRQLTAEEVRAAAIALDIVINGQPHAATLAGNRFEWTWNCG